MNNLKAARKAAGLTQTEVAEAIGITQNGYSYWENGRKRIESDALKKLSEMFGVSVDYLLGKEAHGPDSVKIPVLGSVPAGIPLEAIEDIVDYEEIPASMCGGGREYFALTVKSDSMWPDFLPGDVVIVQKQPTCDTGSICVVYVNGYDATLKEVKLGPNGSITLVPHNQNYAPHTYSPEEVRDTPVSIAGVVVELRRKIKK